MAAAQRMTLDANNGGGTISSVPQSTVYANSKLLSVNGSSVTTHGDPAVHSGTVTANGSSTVFAGGTAVNRTGDADSCGHARTGGSSNVNIG